MLLDGIDQVVARFAPAGFAAARPGLAPHTDEQQGHVGHCLAQKWPLDPIHGAAGLAPDRQGRRLPARPLLGIVLRRGGLVAVSVSPTLASVGAGTVEPRP